MTKIVTYICTEYLNQGGEGKLYSISSSVLLRDHTEISNNGSDWDT